MLVGGWLGYLLAGLAALAAGLVNALAGGGTLITFPALVGLGVPAVVSNITNTVALCPGYLGATLAQSKDLRGQGARMRLLIPFSVLGGVVGGFLLLHTGEKLFQQLVPYLILLACVLLALNDPVRAWLSRRRAGGVTAGQKASSLARPPAEAAAVSSPDRISLPAAAKPGWHRLLGVALPIALAAVYGGYFGAGLSVIVLAALGVLLDDSIIRLNALKQSISFSVNVAAAIFFVFSGQVLWGVALVMMVGALLGGALGGRIAGRIKPAIFRWVVVAIGLGVAVIYFIR